VAEHETGQVPGGFHVIDDVDPRVTFQHVFRQQHQQRVRPDDTTTVVDDAETVAVAVEREADIGLLRLDLQDQRGQVVR
jgi:hypothetical protein